MKIICMIPARLGSQRVIKKNLRLRKIWKAITFINHSFQNYKIVDCEHKLQPKPSYLWFQIKGFFLKYAFYFTEYKIKKDCFFKSNFFWSSTLNNL